MKYRKYLLLFGILAAFVAAGGCPSPGAPPTPPAEIPSLVAFPRTVGIDVSKAAGDSSSALTLAKDPKAETTLENFTDIISLGPIIFNGFNLLLDDFLGPLADLEIPVSPTVTTFEGPITVGAAVGLVKIDFGDFDLNGDGVSEGCTGCTCPTGCAPTTLECPSQAVVTRLKPVCYRIWLRDVGQTEFSRFAAGRFDRYATRDDPATTNTNEENAGEGAFRLGFVVPPPSPARNTLAFGVAYDHLEDSDPLKKETEFFAQDRIFDADGNLTHFDNVHSLVTQEDPTGAGNPFALRKTVKFDQRTTPDPADGPAIVQYIGRFRDDFDFWGGSFNLEDVTDPDPKKVSAENVCARISSGLASDAGNCQDLGIDVDGEPFLQPAVDADVVFPEEFPEAPTF